MQSCLHGRQSQAEQFGGLLAREALEVAEHDDLAFPGRQPFQRTANQFPPRLARRRERLQLPPPAGVDSQLVEGEETLGLIDPAAAEPVGRMARNREEPRPGRPLPTIGRSAPPRCQEGLLKGVLGVRGLAQERGQIAVDRGLVRRNEPVERRVIAGGAPCEERRVGLAQRALAGQVLNPNTV